MFEVMRNSLSCELFVTSWYGWNIGRFREANISVMRVWKWKVPHTNKVIMSVKDASVR